MGIIIAGRYEYLDCTPEVREALGIRDNLVYDLETGIAFVGEVGERPTWEAVDAFLATTGR